MSKKGATSKLALCSENVLYQSFSIDIILIIQYADYLKKAYAFFLPKNILSRR